MHMNLGNIIVILVVFIILVYVYIKRPWKKGYLYVKDNGKIMRGRRYSADIYSQRKEEKAENNEKTEHMNAGGTLDSTQKDEKATQSKFDFLFGNKDDEK